MDQNAFFIEIQNHFDEALPFVVYRKPNQKKVTALLQEEDELYTVSDFIESGFVFAPFDTTTSETILIPQSQSYEMRLDVYVTTQSNEENVTTSVEAAQGAKEQHIALVESGINEIETTGLKKVVLSRKQKINHNYESPISIFKRLLDSYATAFVYCWYHPKVGLWLGATPETLLSVENRKLYTMSLAGTQKKEDTLEVSWGAKEIEEQQLVTDTIAYNLRDVVEDLKVSETHTHQAGTLLHLKTDITAIVHDNDAKLASIIQALHPTPAVCGLPKLEARDFILQNENYNRSYYTGFLGELNIKTEKKRASTRRNVENLAYGAVKKHTHLFVNLRCMEVDAQGAQLYVGGGITASSKPALEWEETVNKLQTVATVL
ncbi:chorismate-binding protein [uncultured Dokdonia sp.]|uniref:chorismate-binding protein n=1 Tax=uncultured Dokdonia sp. TaxID=575653 RepID=UPI0026200353|nr:chorismate-binding protein [uncultured Dokdonia sp.]